MPFYLQAPESKIETVICAACVDDGEERRQSLRAYGGEGGPGGPPAEQADEHEIADDVGDTGDADKDKRRSGIPEAAKNGGEGVVGEHRSDPRGVDEDIASRLFDSLGRRPEQVNYRVGQREQQRRDDDAEGDEEREHRADGILDLMLLSRAEKASDHYRASHGEADDDAVYHEDELAADRDRGESRGVGELSDDYHVGRAVERLQQVRRHIRDREARQQQRDAALGQRLRAGGEYSGK